MRQPPSLTSRQLRLFLGWTSVVGLAAAFVNQASCARLHGVVELTPGTGTSSGDGGTTNAGPITLSTRDLDEAVPDTVVDGGLPTVTPAACGDANLYNVLTHTPGIL